MPINVEDISNDEDGFRWYTIDGKKYVSVTTVLDLIVERQLKNWFIKTSQEDILKKQEETKKIGSELHEQAATGNEDRFNQLIKSLEMDIIDSETVVCSSNGWAGRYDYKVRRNGKLGLLDAKSGKFGAKTGLQLGAYSLAANEKGDDIREIGVISLPRDLTKEAKHFDYSKNFDNCQYTWCAMFDVWKHINYKKLLNMNWEFFGKKTTIQYKWDE